MLGGPQVQGRGAGIVVMRQVPGQHLAQMVLIDDQQPVEELARKVPMNFSQMA